MSQAHEKSIFLDVDSSIVENNLRIAKDTREDEFQKFFDQESYPSKVVKPSPGFCVKTKEVASETKVFVNICKTDSIPPPKDISSKELAEIIESDEPGDYRVPMSIGEIRTEKDKKERDAKAVDVAIHPDFFKKVEEIEQFKNFFMAVVFQGLENKYGLVCVDEKNILRNKKAFGNLQVHRIQQRDIDREMHNAGQKSLISELTGEQEPKKVVIETLSSAENLVKEPNYRLYKKKNGQNSLYGEFQLPNVISAEEITLDIGEDRILLESKEKGYLLDIFVPYVVKQKVCSSTFNKSTKILTVTMPLVGG